MISDQLETNVISSRLHRGVLVVRIELNSLMQELIIHEVETNITAVLPRASQAVLVDCESLTLHVSSQFLSSLMSIYRLAQDRGIKLALCNLSNSLKAGYEVTALTSIIPAYESQEEGLCALQNLSVGASESPSTPEPSRSHDEPVGIRLSTLTVSVAVFAFLFLGSAAYMLGTLQSKRAMPSAPAANALPAPFETHLHGRILASTQRARIPSWVVAWPPDYIPDQPITEARLRNLESTSSSWQSLVALTRTDAEGRFSLPVRGFGPRSRLRVLVLGCEATSNQLQEVPAPLIRDVLELDPTFLTHRPRKITEIEIRPDAVTEYRWRLVQP